MDDLDETTIPFTIIDTRVDTRVSDVRASRKAESWDEHASSKAFKSSCASHPDNGGVRQGFDVVPLVLETINMASTTLRDDDDEEEDLVVPMHLQTPDEEMGIPGQWESVKKPSDFTTSPTSSEINEMEGWEPEKVPLPAWAVDGKVVGTGGELKDGAEEFSEYARGFKDGGELAESIAKKQRNG
ncbi:hypothetical protein TrST_g6861 [Triparma strigata]|uniref:Uncharacterized protein n=1 Tax=Triparma strigata TaxID=1606541 RepID=A0A9W7BRE1_9STRA|nr:hypothetical protein TrST_g6861 [Triparma strigata]